MAGCSTYDVLVHRVREGRAVRGVNGDGVYYTECRWCAGPEFGETCPKQNKKGMTCTREPGHDGRCVVCTGDEHEVEKF